jgi:outer membrane protein assembly factor BamB
MGGAFGAADGRGSATRRIQPSPRHRRRPSSAWLIVPVVVVVAGLTAAAVYAIGRDTGPGALRVPGAGAEALLFNVTDGFQPVPEAATEEPVEAWRVAIDGVVYAAITAYGSVWVLSLRSDGLFLASFDGATGEPAWSTLISENPGDSAPALRALSPDVVGVEVTETSGQGTRIYLVDTASGAISFESTNSVPFEAGEVEPSLSSAGALGDQVLLTINERSTAVDASTGRVDWADNATFNPRVRSAEIVVAPAAAEFRQGAVELVRLDHETGGSLWSVEGERFGADVTLIDDTVYVFGASELSARGDDPVPARVVALDADTGAEEWSRSITAAGPIQVLPAADGSLAVVTAGEVLGLDAESGDVRWTQELAAGRLSTFNLAFAIDQDGQRILALEDGDDLVLLEAETGEPIDRVQLGGAQPIAVSNGFYLADLATLEISSVGLPDLDAEWTVDVDGGLVGVIDGGFVTFDDNTMVAYRAE